MPTIGPRLAGRWPSARSGGGSAASRMRRRSCVNETGLRNSAHGADKFGLKDLAGVHWNLPPRAALRIRDRREGRPRRRGRRVLRRDRHPHRPLAEGQVRRLRRLHREDDLVGEERQAYAAAVRRAAQRFPRARQGQAAVRAGPLWRRRSEIPHQGARVHRTRLALDVHPLAADPARSQGAAGIHAGFHHPVPADLQGRSEKARRAQRDRDRAQLHQAHDPDRRLASMPAR